MLTMFRLLVIGVLMLSATLQAEDKVAIAVNPVGEPKALTKGNAIRYFLWNDAGEWHLRTDTAGKAHVFNGTVEIVGGKVTEISDFENLEAGKKKKNSDLGVVNRAKDQISFKFTTSKKRDGFNFKVDDSATEIRFKLLIDGKVAPDRVLIGPNSQPSPTDILVLPANPS